jgi:hypothetical protein
LTNSDDATNDLFNVDGGVPGGGPDPTTPRLSFTSLTSLAPGSSATKTFTNVNATADYCGFVINGDATVACATGLANADLVTASAIGGSAADQLKFWLSTVTEINESLTGGDDSTSQSTSVVERVTVTYDYSAASTITPEPVTALLFGSGLIALGLFRRQRR